MNQGVGNGLSALGRSVVFAVAFGLLAGLAATPAQATESIDSFTSTVSTT